MGAEKLKREIVESLDNLSEKYLRAVYVLIRSLEESEAEVPPMNPRHKDITADDIKAKLKESRSQAERGETYTLNEVKAMIENKRR